MALVQQDCDATIAKYKTQLEELASRSAAVSKESTQAAQQPQLTRVQVDEKSVIRQLLIKYFNMSAKDGARAEVLMLVTKMLDMNDADRERIGLHYQSDEGTW